MSRRVAPGQAFRATYRFRPRLMKGQNGPGMNQKSGRVFGKLGHFAKTDTGSAQFSLQSNTQNGQSFLTKDWAMKVAHEGRRETFPLGTPNKAVTAATAWDIYLFLVANGWEAALAMPSFSCIPNRSQIPGSSARWGW
jgi:hypothetical protein